jgi:hypothetical protein
MIYHGRTSLDDLPQTVRKTCVTLRQARKVHGFDSIAVAGMSGVIVGIPVGLRLNVPVVIVRKVSDTCHTPSRRVLNASNAGGRCLFLDDFISFGGTFKHVRDMLNVWTEATVVAKYLYEDDYFAPYPSPDDPPELPEPPIVPDPLREPPSVPEGARPEGQGMGVVWAPDGQLTVTFAGGCTLRAA